MERLFLHQRMWQTYLVPGRKTSATMPFDDDCVHVKDKNVNQSSSNL